MDRRRNAVAAVLYDGVGRHSLGDGHLRLFGCLCLQGRTAVAVWRHSLWLPTQDTATLILAHIHLSYMYSMVYISVR